MRLRSALSKMDDRLSQVDSRVVPRLSPAASWLRVRWRRARANPLPVFAVLAVVIAASVTVAGAIARRDPVASGHPGSVWVGPHEGDSVPAYLAQGRAELTALAAQAADREVYALVSLDHYFTPDAVAGLLAGAAGVSSVTGKARVPLADRQTEVVSLVAIRLPGDLVTAMVNVANRKDDDVRKYDGLAAAQSPGSLREIYTSNAEVSRAEAAAYRGACACVFALIVRGTPGALLALADQPSVRVVDPAPEVTDPADAVFNPPLPEQTDRVAPPGDGLLPSASR